MTATPSKRGPRSRKAPKPARERDLTAELSLFLSKTLLPDLQVRARQADVARALAAQHQAEKRASRTADTLGDWTARTLEQVGVAWILSCVFVCILEARGHLERPRLAGEGAQDSEHLFFELFPSLTLRDYLLAVFRELSHVPGGEDVLGPAHNPAWRLSKPRRGPRAGGALPGGRRRRSAGVARLVRP